jgi:hypothetical protein
MPVSSALRDITTGSGGSVRLKLAAAVLAALAVAALFGPVIP